MDPFKNGGMGKWVHFSHSPFPIFGKMDKIEKWTLSYFFHFKMEKWINFPHFIHFTMVHFPKIGDHFKMVHFKMEKMDSIFSIFHFPFFCEGNAIVKKMQKMENGKNGFPF